MRRVRIAKRGEPFARGKENAKKAFVPARIVQSAIPGQEKRFDRVASFFSLAPVSDYDNDCRILEIKPGASLAEIRQAYRDQTKVWHPDRFSNDVRLKNKADEKLKQINLAYRRLCGSSPYEPRVLSPAIPGPSSDWIAVFALRRALRNSVTVISKRFSLL